MATRNGYLVDGPDYGVDLPVRSAQVLGQSWPNFVLGYSLTALLVGHGPRTPVLPVASHAVDRAGYVVQSYFDDFYNRIHVAPLLIDFGNMVPPQQRTIEVWNAYFDPKALTAITPDGDATGLTIAPAPPMEFQPLQAHTFTLTADTAAPPALDVSFDFTWTGADSPPVHVTGATIIAVPWRQLVPMGEILRWLTDLHEALDGSEQAASLRETPRQSYEVTLYSRNFSGLQHAFVKGYGRGFAVPMVDEGQRCHVQAGSSEVRIDTTAGDWREMVMVWVDDDDYEVIEIDSVLPDRLLLKRPATATRTGWAYPTATAYVSSPPVRTVSGRAAQGRMAVGFEFGKGRNLAGAASPMQWEGYDVLLDAPQLLPVEDRLRQRIDTLDNATGWPVQDRYWAFAKIGRPMRWEVELDALWSLRAWLHRRRGMWRPFWQPTFETDFIPQGVGTVGGTLLAKPNGYEHHFKPAALAILKHDGNWVFANVIGAASAGALQALTLSPGLATLEYDQIRRVSLMRLKRLANDQVRIGHIGRRRAEVVVDVVEVE